MREALRTALVVCTLAGIGGGCWYSTYTGIYWVERTRPTSDIQFHRLRDSVASAIQEFGFRNFGMPQFEDEVSSFIHTRQTIKRTTAHLEGAYARITIAVGTKPLTITIRYLSNNHETEFVRALKERIEKQLEADFGVRSIQFERQMDILS